jgi:pimeloyl-ACP methyl ester carboxylesterase
MLIAAAVSAASCTDDEKPTDTAPATAAPDFRQRSCLTGPEGQRFAQMRCGSVTVPENRDAPNGRTLNLAVLVLLATGPDAAPDPIVFLSGGPGVRSLDGDIYSFAAEIAAPLQNRRDIVFFDQRGVGRSDPDLTCPATADEYRQRLGKQSTVEEILARANPLLFACRERLIGDGIDLSQYRSSVGASDIHDVMTALGYREWNLYGYSYGTRLALTALRDRPEGIRSAVLDSPVPLQITGADFPRVYEEALRRVFADCVADAACGAAYPDAEGKFYDAIARLNDSPATLEITDASGEALTVVMTGGRFLQALFGTFSVDTIPRIPSYAEALARDDDSPLPALAQVALAPRGQAFAEALSISVLCAEEAIVTEANVERGSAGVRAEVIEAARLMRTGFPGGVVWAGGDLERAGAFCAAWRDSPVDVRELEPVSSDVPVLILAGRYDPITPPEFGATAAETLLNS